MLNLYLLIGASADSKGYDCIMIPGAASGTQCNAWPANAVNANRFCGNSVGLAKVVTASIATTHSGTVCSKDHNNFIRKHSILIREGVIEFRFISCYNV